jgi:hypothetical protein
MIIYLLVYKTKEKLEICVSCSKKFNISKYEIEINQGQHFSNVFQNTLCYANSFHSTQLKMKQGNCGRNTQAYLTLGKICVFSSSISNK